MWESEVSKTDQNWFGLSASCCQSVGKVTGLRLLVLFNESIVNEIF